MFRRNICHLSFQKDQIKVEVVKGGGGGGEEADKRSFKSRNEVQMGKTEELKLRHIS